MYEKAVMPVTNASVKRVTLSIGEYYASREPAVIRTLLGSCVSVCLFDPVSRVGGMNHILLPGRADLKRFNLSARYGINSMELLINAVMMRGAERSRIRAKVFGGASVIPGLIEAQAVGRKLSEFVITFLANEGIPVVSRDLGGIYVRKLIFHTRTGDAFLKKSRSMKSAQLMWEERKKAEQIRATVKEPTKVTLF
ncbi:chemotaxis protein CheD [Desulfoluna spongiiphila]|uniref:Probable chemoreceptor glutamine deamidase CheD n=1 Tax=Desulfoluna spongiiphila TaxID=419481 RepID=A0A1G5F6R0_9BACT|nr:chemotaxis protein CheD [Desulfoluna spongiiphila]SCY34328.1 chemotaxis protein CheD [Desulfoluna spongiiphila]